MLGFDVLAMRQLEPLVASANMHERALSQLAAAVAAAAAAARMRQGPAATDLTFCPDRDNFIALLLPAHAALAKLCGTVCRLSTWSLIATRGKAIQMRRVPSSQMAMDRGSAAPRQSWSST